MSDQEDENNKKPDLKVVSLSDKVEKPEINTQDFTSRAVHAYALSRAIFAEIDDFLVQDEAISYLRKAFLIAINPLKQVDDQFDFFEFEEEDL